MTINGSTNSNQWTYKLEVNETATSIQNNTSTVQVQAYLGRASSQSYLGGNYSVSVNCDGQSQDQDGNIAYPTYINAGEWLLLKTFTFTVTHNSDGTKTANISSSFSSNDFTPSSANASGSIRLSDLHKPPEFGSINYTELNQDLRDISIGSVFVQYLSEKRFTISTTTYDSATITSYRIYHNDVLIGQSSSNQITIDFANVGPLTTRDLGTGKVATIRFEITDSLGASSSKSVNYATYLYNSPTYENTSTYIKRKTGSGIVLTDNKAELFFKGTYYNENNNVGNNNTYKIEYKIWSSDSLEPSSYTNITSSATVSGNNITISNYELTNLIYSKPYNYKIKISDSFGGWSERSGILSTGISIFTEYPDRVDFYNLTVKGYNPFEYSDTETICGVWLNKPLYRKVLVLNYYSWSVGDNTFAHNISNLETLVEVDYLMLHPNGKWYNNWDAINTENWTTDTTNLTIVSSNSASFNIMYLILEYTKTTD